MRITLSYTYYFYFNFISKDPFTAKNNSQVFYCQSLSIAYLEVNNLIYSLTQYTVDRV